MSLLRKIRRDIKWVGVACVGLLALACTTDPPTAPVQVPALPPGGGSVTVWNITVTVDPSVQTAGSTEPSTITIQVRRAGGSPPPANGTTIVVTASLGDLGTLGSGVQSAVLTLINGLARVFFFAGDIIGDAVVTAQLEGSIGQRVIEIRIPETLFITALTPNIGPQVGGTRVRIDGTGFDEPLQVFFGDLPATVVKVGRNGFLIRVDTPRIFDPDAFFDSEACDADGDGVEDGVRLLPTAVDVTVELRSGTPASATLPSGYTYSPANSSCVEPVEPPPDPVIFILSVTPNTGPAAGGTAVTITGRGFIGALRV
ncbi:MAG: IPT/TIG domain-containing protein, partial [Thermoanaerobaculia bacterium]